MFGVGRVGRHAPAGVHYDSPWFSLAVRTTAIPWEIGALLHLRSDLLSVVLHKPQAAMQVGRMGTGPHGEAVAWLILETFWKEARILWINAKPMIVVSEWVGSLTYCSDPTHPNSKPSISKPNSPERKTRCSVQKAETFRANWHSKFFGWWVESCWN